MYNREPFIKADGFDEAIIGYSTTPHEALIYSVSKCLKILEKEMTSEEAVEWFGFNMEGSYLGDHTPIWCWDENE